MKMHNQIHLWFVLYCMIFGIFQLYAQPMDSIYPTTASNDSIRSVAEDSPEFAWYSQRDSRWSGEYMGSGSYTMGEEGCAVTCVAMLDQAEKSGTSGSTTPKDMNDYLGGPADGYEYINGHALIRWEVADDLDGDGYGLEYIESNDVADNWTYLDQQLNLDRKVVVKVTSNVNEHWVLVYKKDGSSGVPSSYSINDPYPVEYESRTLQFYQGTSSGGYTFLASRTYEGTWETTTPTITVTNPQAGWTWNFGGTHLVEWDYSGFSGDIAIDLYKGDVNQIRLVSSTPVDDRKEYITLPDWLDTGDDYRIGLSSVPSGDPWDFSDYFSIRQLTVAYPNGGESFNPSQVVNVQWNSNNVTSDLLIDLYKGGTSNDNWVATLASATPNDGNENVTLPSDLSTANDYLIGISGHGGYVWDFSDNYFTVEAEGYAAVSDGVSVTPSTIYTGDTFDVTFTLKEINGGIVTYSDITCAILDVNNNHLFDLEHHSNITISANGTWTYPTSNGYLNDPGTYKAVARGKVNDWFDFTTTDTGINPFEFTVYVPSAIDNNIKLIPSDFSISQNYPNPFNAKTRIDYSVPKTSHVRITIYNLSGEKLITLIDQEMPSGNHSISWDASSYATGIFLYRFETADFNITKKCMLIK